MHRKFVPALGLTILLTLTMALAARAGGALFQASTIDALLAGVYDGSATFAELAAQGDFGLGTVDKLNGEMVALDGRFYQVTVDGRVHVIPPDMTTPFADVTFFKPDMKLTPRGSLDLAGLEKFVESRLPSLNLFYALRIDGVFAYLKVRSVPGAGKPPYPRLVEIVKRQRVFELRDIKGTIVGFYSPAFVKGIGVPGFHLHFISQDRKKGGHVLGLRMRDLAVQTATLNRLNLALPLKGGFMKARLGADRSSELRKVEKDR